MFQLLFERSGDAIILFDPQAGVVVDCNPAAVSLLHARAKEELLQITPADISPPFQPDGSPSAQAAQEIVKLVQENGTHRFEWLARRLDGTTVPLETLATAIPVNGRVLHVLVPRDISQRKKVEAEVRELNTTLECLVAERTAELTASEARLRTLLENAPEAIVVFDGQTGRFLSGNGHACRMYGYCPEELTRKTPADVSPEFQANGRRSAEVAREKMDEALAGGTPVFEWIHRHANGRLIPTEVRLVRLPSEGRPLLRASIIDNTERKRRESIQRATFEISEAVHMADDLASFYRRVHNIVQTLMPAKNFYISVYDASTGMISFPYFVDETEPPPTPFPLGKGLTSYVLRTGKPLLVGAKMNARKQRVGSEVTFQGFPELHYVESGTPAAIWVGVPLTVCGPPFGMMALQDYHDDQAYGEEEKQILSFVAKQIALAIERKRAETALRESAERLRESEARFSAAFHANPVLSAIASLGDGRFVEANEAFLNWSGYGRQEVLGHSSADLKLWVDPGAREAFWRDLRALGKVRHRESEMRDRSGIVHTGLLSADIIEINKEPHVLIVALDITARKRAEMELWRTLEREKELSQLKTNFVSMVSHEFRTPLGIILSSAQILADYLEQLPEAERREHLDAIARSSKHMGSLMEEVLVLSRVESGKMGFEPAPVQLASFLQRLVDEVYSSAGNECPISLDVSCGSPTAMADERLLRHIFTNLLSNAVKYSTPGAPVTFRVEREGERALFIVGDRGIGIPEADKERLFTAFHRGSNVGQVSGSGLGLIIVKHCVELHGGSLQIQSKPAEGTKVTVSLPVFPQLDPVPAIQEELQK
jgi:PAS domain S-box-containing protein